MTAGKDSDHNVRAALYLILAGMCAALHVWKLPPALPALRDEMGLTLMQSGFLLSIVQIGGMTLGLLVGLMAERIGLRRCIMIGLALLAMASAAAGVFSSVGMLMVLRAIEGCGLLMASMPVPSLIRRLVPPAGLSRIMALWSCYMPAGAVLILIGGAWLLGFSDWRTLWMLLGALSLAMLAVIWRVVPADARPMPAPHPAVAAPRAGQTALQMIRTTLGSPRVWLVTLTFSAYSAQWIAVIGFLPTIYAAAGVGTTTAGLLTGLVAGANIIGNLLAGQLLHRQILPHRLLMTGFLTMAICAYATFGAGLPVAGQFSAVIILSAVGGLIPATLFVLAIAVAPTPQTTTTTVGWLQQCSSLGQFCGPPIVAWVVGAAGGWQATWLATGAFALAGCGLALALARRPGPTAAPAAAEPAPQHSQAT